MLRVKEPGADHLHFKSILFLHFPSVHLYSGDDTIIYHMHGLKGVEQGLVDQCQQNLGYGGTQHDYYYCHFQLCVLQFDF